MSWRGPLSDSPVIMSFILGTSNCMKSQHFGLFVFGYNYHGSPSHSTLNAVSLTHCNNVRKYKEFCVLWKLFLLILRFKALYIALKMQLWHKSYNLQSYENCCKVFFSWIHPKVRLIQTVSTYFCILSLTFTWAAVIIKVLSIRVRFWVKVIRGYRTVSTEVTCAWSEFHSGMWRWKCLPKFIGQRLTSSHLLVGIMT